MCRGIGIFLFFALIIGVKEIDMLPDSLKQIASTFLKEMEDCKIELGIKDSILSEFYRLWKEEYDSITRETGCLLNCMSKKVEIFNVEGKLHHANTKEFAMKNGADEHIATQLVNLIHECEMKLGEIPDECLRTLELTKCARRNFRQVKWTLVVEDGGVSW